ncbi:ornithine cyclodeaminase [Legionella busanensis]|uniref:Ornithine cyclodeaminase n=1 Tax=Legionella busanensis TaxID=190655 RepID=A0A378JL17_9GAMM|nr:ornithine cyclodeaminase family protein [Legionella busanensis]STX51431.1 ornithine cyclodeaminase [Legionella busanensis]
MSLKLLSLNEVKQSISMPEAIDALEDAFIQLARQQVKLPLRMGINIAEEDALTLAMPAYLAHNKALGLKVVSIFPKNLTKHKPSITGFIMLLDALTGEPKVLMDGSYLTALRTGAVSGLATKYFAKKDAEHLAIIGSGAQAYMQLEAVAAVCPIKQVSIWSRSIANAEHFAERIPSQYKVQVHTNVADTVKDADVICTVTSSTKALIDLSMLKSNAHINAIGSHTPFMQEINFNVLQEAVVIVDQIEAALKEAGEIITAINQQQLKQEDLIEIGHWLVNRNENYKSSLTVFKSVGLAIQDLSVAEVVYQNALKQDLGLSFSLN